MRSRELFPSYRRKSRIRGVTLKVSLRIPRLSPGMTASVFRDKSAYGGSMVVRVGEKEYGPLISIPLATGTGRPIAADNEVRRESESDWTRATTIPGLFSPPPLQPRQGIHWCGRARWAKSLGTVFASTNQRFCVFRSDSVDRGPNARARAHQSSVWDFPAG